MRTHLSLIILSCFIAGVSVGCSPSSHSESSDEKYLNKQSEEQGYPVLIASPHIADYGLPFCEKNYCLEVEIFGFKSQDIWFNQYVDQKIADLIRKQLDFKQKLSLQGAVDEFVRQSDQWQENHPKQPWSMFIYPNVVYQQDEIAVLQIQTEYMLGDKHIDLTTYYDVVDRKSKNNIRLYDLIRPEARLAFSNYLVAQYQNWLKEKSNPQDYPQKIYWANQDWFIDEEGVVIYYRATDFNSEDKSQALIIYLPKDKAVEWIDNKKLQYILYK